MTPLEDKVRDAIRVKAGEVPPSAVPPLRLPARRAPSRRLPGHGRPGRRWRGWAAPLAAAAAVIAVVAGTQAVFGAIHSHGTARLASGQMEGAFAITTGTGTSPLQVRRVATGAVVAHVRLPAEPGSQARAHSGHDGRTYVGGMATANGRTYVVALYRPHPCRSWLYRFGLNSRGQPTAVTTMSTVAGAEVYDLALSGNGHDLGYTSVSSGPGCDVRPAQPSYIGIVNMITGAVKRWTVPLTNSVNNVSLSGDGGLLLYSLQLRPSAVRVIPASARPGPAADRGRNLVQAARFGRSRWTSFAAIAPDGRTFCYSIYPPGGGGPGKILVGDLATGRSRVVASGAVQPGLIASDPAVRQLLLYLPRGLVKLDLSTGKVTRLPGWKGFLGTIAW